MRLKQLSCNSMTYLSKLNHFHIYKKNRIHIYIDKSDFFLLNALIKPKKKTNKPILTYLYIAIALRSDIPDVASIDITDNNIETHTAHHLDRKKRDVDDESENDDDDDIATETTDSDDTSSYGNESDANAANRDVVKNVTNSKRTVRQLRPPPPIGPWPFGDNFDLPTDPRLHSTSRAHPQSGHFQRDTELSSVNYNTFLTPPGSARSADFYKNDGSPSSAYYQLPPFNKPNEYNPYGNPYGNFKNLGPNAVTEYNSPKPYTITHTTFDVGDAQTHHFKPSKLVSQQPFYPLVSNNGSPKPLPKLQNQVISNTPAEDVDSLPENFSYYHMGNGVQIKQDLNRHQQPIQQAPKISQPQAPVYYLDKPSKILGAATQKPTHYIHVSTVGGFLNNNPTAFSAINQKKPKLRPSTEKYNEFTHRPVFREPAAVHENNQNNNIYGNTYNVQENTDVSPYYNPLISQRPTIATPIATSPKSVFNNELPFSNFDQSKLGKPLYSYEVTTDEVKPVEKVKGFYLTQPVKDISAEKPLTRPSIKLQNHDAKNYAQISVGQKKRPSVVGPQVGVDFDFNKFIYDIRETQNFKPTPKYNTIARPVQPETVIIRAPNKPVGSKTKIQTTTPSSDDYYYDVDEEEIVTTTVKRPTPPKEPSSTTPKHTTTTLAEYSTKPVKTNFVNGFSHPSIISTPQSFQTTYKPKDPKPSLEDEEYYEYEDDEDDTSEIKMPPQNVSKFMPMSETAAPRPYLTTVKTLSIATQRPLTTTPSPTTKKYSTTFERHTKPSIETTPVPAIIKFPDDVFQGVRQNHNDHTDIPRYLNQSTLRPYTSRTRSKATNLSGPVKPSKAPKMHIKTTSKTTSSSKPQTTQHHTSETTLTTSTPKTKTFAIRAKHNYNTAKGQQQSQSQSQSQSTNNSNRWRQETKSQKAQRPNALKKNLWELDERLPNRYHLSCNAKPKSN